MILNSIIFLSKSIYVHAPFGRNGVGGRLLTAFSILAREYRKCCNYVIQWMEAKGLINTIISLLKKKSPRARMDNWTLISHARHLFCSTFSSIALSLSPFFSLLSGFIYLFINLKLIRYVPYIYIYITYVSFIINLHNQ